MMKDAMLMIDGKYKCLALLALALIPISAHAGLLSQVNDLLASNISSSDESMAMLRNVVGDFVLDPFAQGGAGGGSSGTVLGEMFKTFNMFIFITAMIWFSYNCAGALAQTMHEGVILGQRMSTVWLPIRVAFGAASLMPVFGGWAFCQALMVIGATMGIAGANAISKTAVTSSAQFQVTVNPMGSVKQAKQLHDLEGRILLAAACTRAANYLNAEAVELRGVNAVTDYSPTLSQTVTTITMAFPNNDGAAGCGRIVLKFSPRSNNVTLSDITGSTFGFRVAGVNYEGIRSVAIQSHMKTLKAVYTQANKIIDGALSTEANSAAITNAVALLKQGYFGSYSQLFQEQLADMTSKANSASNVSAISDQLLNKMQEGGWATLGIWYGVFAEVNEAMNEMLDPVATFDNPKLSMTSVDESVQAALSGLIAAAQARDDSSSSSGLLETATGNTSLGQAIMGSVMNVMGGSSSTGMSKTINPIIAYKNIGDNALTIAQTLYFAYKAVQAIPFATKIADKVMDLAASSSGIMKAISSIVTDAGALIVPIAFILFATAAAMAFYLPMLPFIQWFAALVQWFTSILESLVGGSLWALAHFDSDGEGMGQRSSYGYLYLFNNFARPITLTLAFFFAAGTVTVLGSFLFKYFGSTVAAAQGNSLTGVMSIVAYLIILTVMGMTLINSSFSLLLSMPDRLIGWIGQNHASHIGSDVESRVNGVFINAARAGASTMAPKSPAGGGDGGGGGGGFMDSIKKAKRAK
jgi:conjugal transfer/type IV secretion protein DotA/TraY